MSQNDLVTELTGMQTTITYTIGFGNGISATGLQLLQDTAYKSGGGFYVATDMPELVSTLQQIMSAITMSPSTP